MNEVKNDRKMRANTDPEGSEIRLLDAEAIFVRLERVVSRPGQQFPNVTFHVKCFPLSTFEHLESLRNQKNPINWVSAGGFHTCRVIHDPRILTVAQKKEIADYKAEIFKPKMAQESDLAGLRAEVARLKRQIKKM